MRNFFVDLGRPVRDEAGRLSKPVAVVDITDYKRAQERSESAAKYHALYEEARWFCSRRHGRFQSGFNRALRCWGIQKKR
jgi:hypothetical protein